jgi:CBS domain-containing protein
LTGVNAQCTRRGKLLRRAHEHRWIMGRIGRRRNPVSTNWEVIMKTMDVMTHCVVSIVPGASIRDAIARMISHQVSGMPVIDADGKLVGIVTESDFLRRAEMHTEAPPRRWLELISRASTADEYARSHGRSVSDVMSTDVITVRPETALAEVVRLMEEHGIKRIPVTEDGRVVGIVSRADLMTALGESLMKPKQPASSDDQSIRHQILSEMKRQSWCPVHSLEVKVRNGVVELKGTIFDERQRRALSVLVGNVDGVRGTRDHLALFKSASEAPPETPARGIRP